MQSIEDIKESLQSWRAWSAFALQEIKSKYERSIIGPLWITAGLGTLVASLGYLYPSMFGTSVEDYVPYLTTSFLAWFFLTSLLNEGCFAILNASGTIKQIRLPVTFFCFQTVFRNIIVFAHNVLVFIAVVILVPHPITINILYVIPGFLLFCLFSLGAVILIAVLSARFRDIPQAVATLLQISFFLTPVFWRASEMPNRIAFIYANPLFHLLEIIRQPLLGHPPSALNWAMVGGMTVLVWLAVIGLLEKFKHRVSFWV